MHRAFLIGQRRQSRFTHYNLETVSGELPVVSPDLLHRSDHSQVLLALGKVDQIYQAALALFYLEDFSYRDIALVLEVPVGTVKSRMARGIRQLRKILLPDDCVERDVSSSLLEEPLCEL
jgi:RNA polymerase sigma-70 factor (ECF subfamily)